MRALAAPTRVVISGLTAAGKTTHGKILADQLGLSFVSSTKVLAEIAEQVSGNQFSQRWNPEMDELRLKHTNIDQELDIRLSRQIDSRVAVYDACLLPWVNPRADTLYIWLDSGLLSRTKKCFVSHLDDLKLSLPQAAQRVLSKDAVTVSQIQQSRSCSIWPDPLLFHVIISNEETIPEPTLESARSGIDAFHPVLLNAVQYALGEVPDAPQSPWILRLRRIKES